MANDIVTHLRGDKSDLEKSLNDGESLSKGFADRMTTIFAGVAASIAAAFTARALVEFLRDSVNEASEAEEALAKLNAMIRITGGSAGVTADEIQQLGTQMQLTTRYTDDEVIATAALLMRYKSLQGEGLERTIKLSADLAALMGGDLRSSAQQLGRALESPEHASRILRMAGITLTDAQEKQIKSFVELGQKTKAQEIIFDLLESRVKGLAVEMGDTLSGQTAKLNNALGEVKETIGGAIIPLLKELVPLLRTGADAYAALGEEIAASIAAANPGEGGFEKTNETLLDMVTILATLSEHWSLLSTSIAAATAGGAASAESFFENMAQKAAEFMGSADEGENASEQFNIIASMIGLGKGNDLIGAKALETELDKEMSRIQAKIKESRDRMRKDMEQRKSQRENAGKLNMAGFGEEPDLLGDPAFVAAQAAEEEARLQRQVGMQPGRRGREKRGAEAGFGQGAGGGKEDDLFSAQVVGIEDLHRRISQSAASESPAKKVEDAVIKSGIKVAEAVERVERILQRDEQLMTEQTRIIKERGSEIKVLA